jgi:hypothetical protein
MSFSNAGKNWNRAELRAYLKSLKRPDWIKGVTFHHTAFPDLKMRPAGWSPKLIGYMRDGYQNDRGWNRGPHFYPDDNTIWGLTPPDVAGIHAVSFNRTHVGIEVLGNYDEETHLSGRGARCWSHAFDCAAEVLEWAGLQPGPKTVNFHRDDPKTSKSCPGSKISKEFAIEGVIAAANLGNTKPAPEQRVFVVVAEWLRVNGRTEKLTKKENQFFVGSMWIESARYDKEKQATFADEAELRKDILGL